MQHLEEGTIHAWLDGELSPAEQAAAEEHVASCDECKAAIAEARGFIAASSRILTALDAVPGDVVPASSTAAKMRAPAKFTISRAWMAAAAVLVLSTATVIAVRPRGETAALRVAEAAKEEKATAMAPNAGAAKMDTAIVGAQPQSAPLPAAAPAEKLQESADKMSKRSDEMRKDTRAPARMNDSSPMTMADASPAAQTAAPAPPRFGDTATSRPMALNSVAVTGAGTMTAVGKLDAAMASDSAAPRLVSRSAAAIADDTVVTTVYLVNGASVTLLDRSAGHSELRREAQIVPRDQPMAKSRDVSATRFNSLTWSDSTGRKRTLRGAVTQAELERIKTVLFGATP